MVRLSRIRGFVTSHHATTAAEGCDAPTASHTARRWPAWRPWAPPPYQRNLFGKAKVRGFIVEAEFARLPIEKLTVQLS